MESFRELIAGFKLNAPQIPFVSNVTGKWITDAEATDPDYWVRHLRHSVRFADSAGELWKLRAPILLEMGPGQILGGFIMQHPARHNATERLVLTSLPSAFDRESDSTVLLSSLGRLWLAGVEVDWATYHAQRHPRRVDLPTYPFERQRFWIEAPSEAPISNTSTTPSRRSDPGDWFYLPSWRRSLLPSSTTPSIKDVQSWLIFSDTQGLGLQLEEYLRREGHTVVSVQPAISFRQINKQLYTLNPEHPEDYATLIADLITQGMPPTRIVHCWAATSGEVEEGRLRGFYSLLYLAQGLDQQHVVLPLQLDVVSFHTQKIAGESKINAEHATVLGPCKVIPQEYPHLTCRHIDVSPPMPRSWQEHQLLDQLLAELVSEPIDLVVAYRDGQRWVQHFEPTRLQPSPSPLRLREQGVYLITGGLGAIGQVLAEYLARHVHARLALLQRSRFPESATWDSWLATHDEQDPISRGIRNVRYLEQLGAEVLLLTVDVADTAQVAAALVHVEERFGSLHGVIHSAGLVGGDAARPISETHLVDCERHFRPKIDGLIALQEALGERSLDFCLLNSSLSPILGGLGFVAYAAANAYMDAFVHELRRRSPAPWISLNWEGWRFDNTPTSDALFGETTAELSITANEGCEVLRRVLATDLPAQLTVSTGDLQMRLDQWVIRSWRSKPEKTSEATSSLPATLSHPRPPLLANYVAPRTEVEYRLVEVWQDLLGIEQIGIYDNFFELGGNSLLAIRIVSRVVNMFNVQLKLHSLLIHPTVVDLAEMIEAPHNSDTAASPTTIKQVTRESYRVDHLSE